MSSSESSQYAPLQLCFTLSKDASVGHAVVVLKSLVQPDQSPESVSESIKLVSKLVRQLPEITNGSARACVYWLAGQYAESPSSTEQASGGRAFEGLQPWAPDTLRLGAKEFVREVRQGHERSKQCDLSFPPFSHLWRNCRF